MTLISNVLALLVVLCILVLLHEAGHFFTARAFGIRPYIFSFGIGWRLLGLQKRAGHWRLAFGPPARFPEPGEDAGTDYRISMIPFGGYVMLQGESLSEGVSGDPREFRTRPRWQQLIVYVAGVALNIVLAWALATGLFWQRGFVIDTLKEPPVIQGIVPGSGAERAGLRPGDRLLEVEGRDARDQVTLYEQILYSPAKTRTLLIERNGERKTVQLTIGMDDKYKLGVPGFSLQDQPVIIGVEPGTPAERAGIHAGDRIARVDDREAPSTTEVQAIVKSSQGKPVRITLEREQKKFTVEVSPEKHEDTYLMGVRFASGPVRQVGVVGAAVEGVRYCSDRAMLLFITLKQLVRGQISARAMSGPIELAEVSGDRWRQGPAAFIELLAFVSLQLGVINLFPIPGLDGGHILILTVEGLMRRDLPERVKQWVITSGFAVLLLFAGFVMYYDVVKALF